MFSQSALAICVGIINATQARALRATMRLVEEVLFAFKSIVVFFLVNALTEHLV